jgi:hypothetical protein
MKLKFGFSNVKVFSTIRCRAAMQVSRTFQGFQLYKAIYVILQNVISDNKKGKPKPPSDTRYDEMRYMIAANTQAI